MIHTPDPKRPTTVRYRVLGLLALAALINYFHRFPMSVASETIQGDLGLSLKQMGWLLGPAFGIPYAISQLLTGWIGYRWGTRRAFSLYAALWSSLVGLMSLAGGFFSFSVLRVGQGLAQSGFLPCTVNTVSQWFPLRRRGVAAGVVGCSMAVGAALAAYVTGKLLTVIGWRWVFAIYFFPGILWSVWFFSWFRDRPEKHRSTNEQECDLIRGHPAPAETERDGRRPVPWTRLASLPAMWALSAQQLLRGLGFYFFVSWFPKYLRETQGVTDTGELGAYASAPLILDMLGRLVGGVASDWVLAHTGSRWLARSGVASLSLLGCASGFFCACYVDGAFAVTAVLSAGAFLGAMSSPCSHAVSMDIGLHYTAIVFAVMNAVGSLDAFSPVIVAFLVEDAAMSWKSIPFFFAVVYVAAALSWVLLNPNRSLDAAPEPGERSFNGEPP